MKTMLVNKFVISKYGMSVVISLVVIVSTHPAPSFCNDSILFRDEHAEEDDTCHMPSGQIGKCVNLFDCPSRLDIIKDVRLICGWQTSRTPKICCAAYIDHKNDNRNCTTTDNSSGYCVRFTECQLIMSMVLKNPFDAETITYVKSNRCGIKNFDVCCASEHEAKPNDKSSTENDQCQSSSSPQDHSSGCCGQDQYMRYRVIPGEIAEIDQYPWTAILEYDHNSSALKCGGVLISGQYVLTAAHCVSGAAKPINVHLGDFNIENSGPDCVEIAGGGLDCSPGAVSVAIEKVIPHPDFDELSLAKANNIALVRMAEIVPFTDFIKPICLPTADITKTDIKDIEDIRLNVAGWGLTNDAAPLSNVKRIATLSFVSNEICSALYSSNNIFVRDEHICASGIEKDSCKGDAGGALLLEKESHTEVVGLASFGTHPCGRKIRPAVYTNVYHHLTWIWRTIY